MVIGDFARGLRPNHNYERHRLDDLENKLFNMIEIAEVTAVNKANMKVTVKAKAGELTDLHVFVLAQGSGDYKQWIPPVIGDKVLLLADSGDLNGAYCLPIRLPADFESDIPDGAIVKAGDVTVQYNKEDNTYEIKHGSNTIHLDEDKITITVGTNKITVKNNEVKAQTSSSNITLSPTTCNITVPGGVLSIGSGTLSFNGQEVVRV